jgi:hypothetical protein
MTASFHIFPNTLFINQPVILHYIIWAADNIVINKSKNDFQLLSSALQEDVTDVCVQITDKTRTPLKCMYFSKSAFFFVFIVFS